MPKSFFILKITTLIMAMIFCASCTTNSILVEEGILENGVFLLNSRNVKEELKTLDEEGNEVPKKFLKFKDLESRPQMRFRGRLVNDGSKKKGFRFSKSLESQDFDEFHGASEEGEPITFREAVKGAESLTIYVHGFNNSVLDAANQAVDLKRELDAQQSNSVILFYSWPTSSAFAQVIIGGTIRRVTLGKVDAFLNDVYLTDRKNVDLAAHGLYALYEELRTVYPDLTIDMIAHSMGSEVLMKSFLLWHYHQMIKGKSTLRDVRIARRVVLVGADIGIDLFKVLARPSSICSENVLVYVNPADAVLEESSKLNDQARVGASALDQPLPGITKQFTFVQLSDSLVPKGPNLMKQILVNHNPLHDPRILHHCCRFLKSGKIVETTIEMHVHEADEGRFHGSEAKHYELHFDNADIADAVDAITVPIQQLPGQIRGAASAAGNVVKKAVPHMH